MTRIEAAPDWIAHNGGPCPVKPGTRYQAECVDGHQFHSTDTDPDLWAHWGTLSDIVKYREVKK